MAHSRERVERKRGVVVNTIKFHPEIFKMIVSGDKLSTLRLGIKRYTLGPCRLLSVDPISGEPIDCIREVITNLSIVKFGDLFDYHSDLEGYGSDIGKLKEVIRSIYPGIKDDDVMTFVEW